MSKFKNYMFKNSNSSTMPKEASKQTGNIVISRMDKSLPVISLFKQIEQEALLGTTDTSEQNFEANRVTLHDEAKTEYTKKFTNSDEFELRGRRTKRNLKDPLKESKISQVEIIKKLKKYIYSTGEEYERRKFRTRLKKASQGLQSHGIILERAADHVRRLLIKQEIILNDMQQLFKIYNRNRFYAIGSKEFHKLIAPIMLIHKFDKKMCGHDQTISQCGNLEFLLTRALNECERRITDIGGALNDVSGDLSFESIPTRSIEVFSSTTCLPPKNVDAIPSSGDMKKSPVTKHSNLGLQGDGKQAKRNCGKYFTGKRNLCTDASNTQTPDINDNHQEKAKESSPQLNHNFNMSRRNSSPAILCVADYISNDSSCNANSRVIIMSDDHFKRFEKSLARFAARKQIGVLKKMYEQEIDHLENKKCYNEFEKAFMNRVLNKDESDKKRNIIIINFKIFENLDKKVQKQFNDYSPSERKDQHDINFLYLYEQNEQFSSSIFKKYYDYLKMKVLNDKAKQNELKKTGHLIIVNEHIFRRPSQDNDTKEPLEEDCILFLNNEIYKSLTKQRVYELLSLEPETYPVPEAAYSNLPIENLILTVTKRDTKEREKILKVNEKAFEDFEKTLKIPSIVYSYNMTRTSDVDINKGTTLKSNCPQEKPDIESGKIRQVKISRINEQIERSEQCVIPNGAKSSKQSKTKSEKNNNNVKLATGFIGNIIVNLAKDNADIEQNCTSHVAGSSNCVETNEEESVLHNVTDKTVLEPCVLQYNKNNVVTVEERENPKDESSVSSNSKKLDKVFLIAENDSIHGGSTDEKKFNHGHIDLQEPRSIFPKITKIPGGDEEILKIVDNSTNTKNSSIKRETFVGDNFNYNLESYIDKSTNITNKEVSAMSNLHSMDTSEKNDSIYETITLNSDDVDIIKPAIRLSNESVCSKPGITDSFLKQIRNKLLRDIRKNLAKPSLIPKKVNRKSMAGIVVKKYKDAAGLILKSDNLKKTVMEDGPPTMKKLCNIIERTSDQERLARNVTENADITTRHMYVENCTSTCTSIKGKSPYSLSESTTTTLISKNIQHEQRNVSSREQRPPIPFEIDLKMTKNVEKLCNVSAPAACQDTLSIDLRQRTENIAGKMYEENKSSSCTFIKNESPFSSPNTTTRTPLNSINKNENPGPKTESNRDEPSSISPLKGPVKKDELSNVPTLDLKRPITPEEKSVMDIEDVFRGNCESSCNSMRDLSSCSFSETPTTNYSNSTTGSQQLNSKLNRDRIIPISLKKKYLERQQLNYNKHEKKQIDTNNLKFNGQVVGVAVTLCPRTQSAKSNNANNHFKQLLKSEIAGQVSKLEASKVRIEREIYRENINTLHAGLNENDTSKQVYVAMKKNNIEELSQDPEPESDVHGRGGNVKQLQLKAKDVKRNNQKKHIGKVQKKSDYPSELMIQEVEIYKGETLVKSLNVSKQKVDKDPSPDVKVKQTIDNVESYVQSVNTRSNAKTLIKHSPNAQRIDKGLLEEVYQPTADSGISKYLEKLPKLRNKLHVIEDSKEAAKPTTLVSKNCKIQQKVDTSACTAGYQNILDISDSPNDLLGNNSNIKIENVKLPEDSDHTFVCNEKVELVRSLEEVIHPPNSNGKIISFDNVPQEEITIDTSNSKCAISPEEMEKTLKTIIYSPVVDYKPVEKLLCKLGDTEGMAFKEGANDVKCLQKPVRSSNECLSEVNQIKLLEEEITLKTAENAPLSNAITFSKKKTLEGLKKNFDNITTSEMVDENFGILLPISCDVISDKISMTKRADNRIHMKSYGAMNETLFDLNNKLAKLKFCVSEASNLKLKSPRKLDLARLDLENLKRSAGNTAQYIGLKTLKEDVPGDITDMTDKLTENIENLENSSSFLSNNEVKLTPKVIIAQKFPGKTNESIEQDTLASSEAPSILTSPQEETVKITNENIVDQKFGGMNKLKFETEDEAFKAVDSIKQSRKLIRKANEIINSLKQNVQGFKQGLVKVRKINEYTRPTKIPTSYLRKKSDNGQIEGHVIANCCRKETKCKLRQIKVDREIKHSHPAKCGIQELNVKEKKFLPKICPPDTSKSSSSKTKCRKSIFTTLVANKKTEYKKLKLPPFPPEKSQTKTAICKLDSENHSKNSTFVNICNLPTNSGFREPILQFARTKEDDQTREKINVFTLPRKFGKRLIETQMENDSLQLAPVVKRTAYKRKPASKKISFKLYTHKILRQFDIINSETHPSEVNTRKVLMIRDSNKNKCQEDSEYTDIDSAKSNATMKTSTISKISMNDNLGKRREFFVQTDNSLQERTKISIAKRLHRLKEFGKGLKNSLISQPASPISNQMMVDNTKEKEQTRNFSLKKITSSKYPSRTPNTVPKSNFRSGNRNNDFLNNKPSNNNGFKRPLCSTPIGTSQDLNNYGVLHRNLRNKKLIGNTEPCVTPKSPNVPQKIKDMLKVRHNNSSICMTNIDMEDLNCRKLENPENVIPRCVTDQNFRENTGLNRDRSLSSGVSEKRENKKLTIKLWNGLIPKIAIPSPRSSRLDSTVLQEPIELNKSIDVRTQRGPIVINKPMDSTLSSCPIVINKPNLIDSFSSISNQVMTDISSPYTTSKSDCRIASTFSWIENPIMNINKSSMTIKRSNRNIRYGFHKSQSEEKIKKSIMKTHTFQTKKIIGNENSFVKQVRTNLKRRLNYRPNIPISKMRNKMRSRNVKLVPWNYAPSTINHTQTVIPDIISKSYKISSSINLDKFTTKNRGHKGKRDTHQTNATPKPNPQIKSTSELLREKLKFISELGKIKSATKIEISSNKNSKTNTIMMKQNIIKCPNVTNTNTNTSQKIIDSTFPTANMNMRRPISVPPPIRTKIATSNISRSISGTNLLQPIFKSNQNSNIIIVRRSNVTNSIDNRTKSSTSEADKSCFKDSLEKNKKKQKSVVNRDLNSKSGEQESKQSVKTEKSQSLVRKKSDLPKARTKDTAKISGNKSTTSKLAQHDSKLNYGNTVEIVRVSSGSRGKGSCEQYHTHKFSKALGKTELNHSKSNASPKAQNTPHSKPFLKPLSEGKGLYNIVEEPEIGKSKEKIGTEQVCRKFNYSTRSKSAEPQTRPYIPFKHNIGTIGRLIKAESPLTSPKVIEPQTSFSSDTIKQNIERAFTKAIERNIKKGSASWKRSSSKSPAYSKNESTPPSLDKIQQNIKNAYMKDIDTWVACTPRSAFRSKSVEPQIKLGSSSTIKQNITDLVMKDIERSRTKKEYTSLTKSENRKRSVEARTNSPTIDEHIESHITTLDRSRNPKRQLTNGPTGDIRRSKFEEPKAIKEQLERDQRKIHLKDDLHIMTEQSKFLPKDFAERTIKKRLSNVRWI